MAATAVPSHPRQSSQDTLHRHTLLSSSSHLSSAPLSTPSQTPSHSSSTHTLSLDNDMINPIHTLAATQEVHIVKVTGDKVLLEPSPVSDSFLHRVGKYVPTAVGGRGEVGALPPSPPESIKELPSVSSTPSASPSKLSKLEHPTSFTSRPILFDEPAPMSSRDRQPSIASSSRDVRFASPASSHQVRRKSSTETRTSLRSNIRPTRASEDSQSADSSVPDFPSKPSINHLSSDGHLLPPPMTAHRPARRNTTGSSPRVVGAPSHKGTLSGGKLGNHAYEDSDFESEQLATDIELHAEQIRRERMSKRAKLQQEAEAALTRGSPVKERDKDENNVLVGNLIGEDHVNYVLMYNMLTGIRIGVSRCQAKIKRPLTDEDFLARHKYSFDIVGNELTPSAKYDFKFKDYASWVFRELREDYFHLDPADYLLSLTSKYILSELGSPGKSGSFFYFSRDYRFIIKTIRHSEAKFLLSILKDYHAHVKNNPHTLLSRFYGLHRVKLPRGRKIHFVIMNNLFPPHRDIHETYDLKGSTVGREYPEDKAQENRGAVLKDLNWINRGKTLELGPEKRAFLTEQIRRDAEFLKKVGVMDYSLLVGIHNMQRGNRDNVRKNTLKVFSPALPMRRRTTHPAKGGFSPEAIAMRRVMRESDPKRLGKSTIRLPEEDTGDRQHFLFYQDEGGIRATDELNESQTDPTGMLYYLGIIDILTPYTTMKKLEHIWKGLKHDRHKISPVEPGEYGDRFFSFMRAIMRGGEGGGRFKAD